jgi:hypothetical protein
VVRRLVCLVWVWWYVGLETTGGDGNVADDVLRVGRSKDSLYEPGKSLALWEQKMGKEEL